MGAPQEPMTKAARDAWIAAAATRVLAASVYRHAGWAAHGLAWIAKKEALETVAEQAIPAGKRVAEAAMAEAAEAPSTAHLLPAGADAAARREAADAYGRAAVWLGRSAKAFERSARFDRAEAAEEGRAARAYGRADLAGRGRAARRRAGEARRSCKASGEWAAHTADEARLIGSVADELANGPPGGAGELSQWMSAQAAKIEVVRGAQAEASEEAAQAAEAWRNARDGLAHATETAKKEAAPADQRLKEEAALPDGRGMADGENEAVRAWEAAMAAAGRAIDAAGDFGELEQDVSRPGDGRQSQRQRPRRPRPPPTTTTAAERHKRWANLN